MLVATVLLGGTSAAAAIALAALIPAVLVDTIEQRLPNRLVGGAACVGAAALAIEWTAQAERMPADPIGLIAIGAGLMAGPLLVLHLVSPTSMGFGDVKLALVAGGAIGLIDSQLALLALVVACGSTVAAGATLKMRHVAFGPGLLFGAIIATAIGGVIR